MFGDRFKSVALFGGGLFFLLIAIGCAVLFVNHNGSNAVPICYAPYPDLNAGKSQYVTGGGKPTNCTLTLEKADTEDKRTKGLSGRKDMAANTGMLFVFDKAGTQCIWMNDMNFNIDILWLDENKKIIHIERDISPDTYPNNFCGSEPARYVIELKAGVAQTTAFQIGQQLNL